MARGELEPTDGVGAVPKPRFRGRDLWAEPLVRELGGRPMKLKSEDNLKLECRPMPNVMVALPNIGGALCSTPQSLADAHY